jgi:hypothetical protein
VNVLNAGQKSTGLISSLARVGATGSVVGPMIASTNQIPVEILVKFIIVKKWRIVLVNHSSTHLTAFITNNFPVFTVKRLQIILKLFSRVFTPSETK